MDAEAVLLGRVTYEGFAAAWPGRGAISPTGRTLLPTGLVDEWRLMVFPVVLGSGKRLFGETPDKTVLTLAGTQAFASGVVVQTYRPAAAQAT